MKNVFVLLLICIMLISLVACAGELPVKPVETTVGAMVETTSPIIEETVPAQETTTPRNELMYTFKDPSKPVAFDYPNMRVISEGTSRIFANSKFIIAYCRDTKQANLNSVTDELSEKFKIATSSHIEGTFDSFSIENSEIKTITQTEVMLIEGDVVAQYQDGSLIRLPMRGYTFVKGDLICELIAVLNEESNPANQAEMEAVVDAMIFTLREDR